MGTTTLREGYSCCYDASESSARHNFLESQIDEIHGTLGTVLAKKALDDSLPLVEHLSVPAHIPTSHILRKKPGETHDLTSRISTDGEKVHIRAN